MFWRCKECGHTRFRRNAEDYSCEGFFKNGKFIFKEFYKKVFYECCLCGTKT